MAESGIDNLGYDVPQSDTKQQKLLKCVLTGKSKLYLGKVYTEERVKSLVMKKWINSLIIMKLNFQVRWQSLWGNLSSICIQWELVQL